MTIKMINLIGRQVDIPIERKDYFLSQGFREAEKKDEIKFIPDDLDDMSAEEIKELSKTLGIAYTNKKETIAAIKEKYESEV